MSRKPDWQDEYWREVISEAAEHCGAALLPEQIADIADSVRVSHENFSMVSGHDVASANLSASREREQRKLKAELVREQEAEWCEQCEGRGRLTTYGGTMMSNSDCWKCRGKGKLYRAPVSDYERRVAP